MKENVLDVLMYLFETYVDADAEPEPDQSQLRGELVRAGFGGVEIDRALDWLDGLAGHEGAIEMLSPHPMTIGSTATSGRKIARTLIRLKR